MWSSWVKRKGTTQIMYIAKIKDGSKRVKKTFSIIWNGFLKCYDGGGENRITSKKIFEVKVFFSSQNIDFPFYLKELLELFSPSFFYMLHLLRTRGVLMIFEEKNTSSKISF
jgi:hypothetical protein